MKTVACISRAARSGLLLTACVALSTAPLYAQDAEPDLGTEAQREAGREVYMEKCAQCHGEAGDAVSIATPYLRPAPRDFTSAIYKFRTTENGELPTTEDIKRSIREGMPYTSMPAWRGKLSETQITNLAYFIKTFSDDFSGPYGVPQTVEIPRAPGYDEGNLERGREVFLGNQCTDCHGDQGRGNGKSAPTLEDQWGAHIRPADLTKRWTFRNGQTREDIYRTFTTGLDGSPMPAYDMPVEDRWALVDYVWSLSDGNPDYGTMVTAEAVAGTFDISQGAALFEDAEAAYFPVVGQIIEPGRAFNPGVNGIEVKALYNQDEVAILLSWHDMTAETTGSNSPTMAVSEATDSLATPVPDTTGASLYSDAVAVLLPTEMLPGVVKPYFMFGDSKNPMQIWFTDLAGDSAEVLIGRGSGQIEPAERTLDHYAAYEDGVWTVIFKHARQPEGGLAFAEETFVPISFTVWDGFNQERGNRRGLTAWYHLYLAPMEVQSAAIPMAKWALIALLIELLIVGLVRWRARREPAVA